MRILQCVPNMKFAAKLSHGGIHSKSGRKGCGAQLASWKHSPAPNQQQPPPPSDDASSNGALSVHCCSKRSYCFDRHTRAHTHTHTHTQRCARERTHKHTGQWRCTRNAMHHGCDELGDAFERTHLCSKSPGITNLFWAKRRAHLNGFNQSVHRRRACTGTKPAYVASASSCAFALCALIALSSAARACAAASSAFFATVFA